MSGELDTEEFWRVRQIALAVVRREAVSSDDLGWLADTCERLSDELGEASEKTVTADELSEAELRAERAEERLEEVLQKAGQFEKELIALKAENDGLKAFRPERLMFLRKAMQACMSELDGLGSDGAPAKTVKRKRRA